MLAHLQEKGSGYQMTEARHATALTIISADRAKEVYERRQDELAEELAARCLETLTASGECLLWLSPFQQEVAQKAVHLLTENGWDAQARPEETLEHLGGRVDLNTKLALRAQTPACAMAKLAQARSSFHSLLQRKGRWRKQSALRRWFKKNGSGIAPSQFSKKVKDYASADSPARRRAEVAFAAREATLKLLARRSDAQD